MIVDYSIIAAYFLVMIALGIGFSRFNSNVSDFVRGGAQGSWWLVGGSILMSGISAFTFTGNGSAAFEGGPSMLIIYVGNCTALPLCALFLAAWFRQTRAHTSVDVLRARFGPVVEQFSAFQGLLLGPLTSAIQLWALSVFAADFFQVPLSACIVVIGAVVVIYSTTGGRWAVAATDFVQGVLLFAVTLLVAVLAIRHIGGVGAFLSYFSDPRFADDFALVKESDQFKEGRYSAKWLVAIFIMQVYNQINLSSAGRFLSVKDGREACRAAWFAFALMAIGALAWAIPPMVARFLYAEEVMALGGKNPGELAYSYLARQVLPAGMMGLLVAAMFAATSSSMDTGLNNQVGVLVRNVIPRIRAAFGRTEPLSDKSGLLLCKVLTVVMGAIVIGYALLFSTRRELVLFEAFFVISTTVGIPLALPTLAGLWFKAMPRWSYFLVAGACLVPSAFFVYDSKVNGAVWTIQDRALWIFGVGVVATAAACLLRKTVSDAARAETEAFFKNMRTPVDFAREIGANRDKAQCLMLGRSCLVVAAAAALLFLIARDATAFVCVAALVAFIGGIGGLLIRAGRRTPEDSAHSGGVSEKA
ncbi:MAG: hypothetical protein MUE42_06270 [Opitutaceae bacterium]|jgi:Na+/proline symporter|nr:hypothetical protein [Opitutaceae bacterium]